ncbi:MAG: iron chelate uptake ABC transporter family permease subunit [Chlorobi bacterium]|nr:iron chelate uptake ABC transporter family permease subunit [Chlorobiota bacterium]
MDLPIHIFVALAFIGWFSGLMGAVLLVHHRVLIGDVLSHSVLAGVAFVFLLFLEVSFPLLIAGAIASTLLAALLIEFIKNRTPLKEDVVLGIVLAFMFAIGIAFLAVSQKIPSIEKAMLNTLLLGEVSAILPNEVPYMVIASIVGSLVIWLLYKGWFFTGFDPVFGQTQQVPINRLRKILLFIVASGILLTAYISGVVLAVGLLIAPALIGRFFSTRLYSTLLLSGLSGAVLAVLGGIVSAKVEGLSTGPLIIFSAGLIGLLTILFSPHYGIVLHRIRYVLFKWSRGQENILRAAYKVLERTGNTSYAFSLEELKQACDDPPPSWTILLKVLEMKGFVKQSGNKWLLTPQGLEKAKRLTRLHRLLELYLSEIVKIAPEKVHSYAESLEHIITPEVEQRLYELLRDKQYDPHKKPVPWNGSG